MLIPNNVIETLGDGWLRFGENRDEMLKDMDDSCEFIKEFKGLAFDDNGNPKSVWVVYNS